MNYSTLTQIIFLIIAIAIVPTFIRPTLLDIKSLQDDILVYGEAKNKALDFNQKLQSVIAQEQSFQRSDLRALETYLPTTVDTLAVMADIEVIARSNNLTLTTLASEEVDAANEDVVFEEVYYEEGMEMPVIPATDSSDFEVTVTGEYADFKAMLRDLEQNKYPLEVVALQIGATSLTQEAVVTEAGADEATYSLTLRTYAYDYADQSAPGMEEMPPM